MSDTSERNEPPRGGNEEGALGASEEEARRPMPVRAAMEAGEEEEGDGSGAPRHFQDEATATGWLVSVSGHSTSGILPLRTVPLMELTFAWASDPERPRRRVLEVERDLANISDHELLSMLERSEPYREPVVVREDQGRKGGRGTGRPSS